jgi:hypothetical protein
VWWKREPSALDKRTVNWTSFSNGQMRPTKMTKIEPTPEDWERVKKRLEEEDPRQALMERLVQHEAFARVERERADRRRRMLNRLSFGFFARW